MTPPRPSTTDLILVRHGQSLYNRDGETVGLDSGLTELGWRQAQAVADWLADNYRADVVISSRLVRAQQTAEIIAARMRLPVVIHEGIEEAEVAYWDELPHALADPLQAWSNAWQPDADNAPLYTSFRARLHDSLEQLLRRYAGQTAVVVAHGGTIGTILRSLFGGHHITVFTENTGVSQLTWERNQWRLVCHNSTAHLAALAPAPHPSAPLSPAFVSPWVEGRQVAAIADQFQRVANGAGATPAAERAQPDEEHPLRELVQLARPNPNDRVLDAATGMGTVALAFAPHVDSVLALDLSPGMLERAEAARAKRHVQNVHFRLGEIGALPLEPNSFDIITCRDLLHYVTDATALFARFRLLLAPNGRLLIDELIGSDDPVKRATQDAIESRRDPAFTELLSARDIEHKLAAAGLAIKHAERYSVNRELTEWLTQAAADEATRSAVRAMLEAGLEADSAGMNPRRSRENQITFVQARVRILAVARMPLEE